MKRAAAAEAVLALLLGLLLIVTGTLLTDPRDVTPDLRTSTYVNDRGGLRALYLLLQACGAKPERLVDPPATLEDTSATLVIALPTEPVTERDVSLLLSWVERGGRLVVVTGARTAAVPLPFEKELLERIAVGTGRRVVGGRRIDIEPESGADVTAQLEWPARGTVWQVIAGGRTREMVPLVVARQGMLVGSVPYGPPDGEPTGEIVVIADSRLLDNDHLGDADNALLAVGLLTARERDGNRVIFDEYHHGYRRDGERKAVAAALLALITDTWPGRALLALGFAWLVFAAGATVRLGAPLPEPPRPRRALSEHADALGRLLESARARREALHILTAGARRAVGQRARLSPALPPGEFHRRLAASHAAGAAELAAALDAAERAEPRKDVELARLAGKLAWTRRRYMHGGR